MKRYPVLVNHDEGSAWAVSFVDIPAHSLADNLEAALAECQDAFEAFMDGEATLPEPTPLEQVAESEDGRAALAVVLAPIDTSFFDDPTERRTASAKRSQWEAIDHAAKSEGKTRSAYMVEAALVRAQTRAE